jgi:hypothetical protein
MARKGEKIVTQVELESRMRSENKRIDSILDYLVFISGSKVKNFMIQCGIDEFAGAGTTKTFPLAFKTGTVPVVVITSIQNARVVVMQGNPTATNFVGYGRLISDGSNYTTLACWIAIGERG